MRFFSHDKGLPVSGCWRRAGCSRWLVPSSQAVSILMQGPQSHKTGPELQTRCWWSKQEETKVSLQQIPTQISLVRAMSWGHSWLLGWQGKEMRSFTGPLGPGCLVAVTTTCVLCCGSLCGDQCPRGSGAGQKQVREQQRVQNHISVKGTGCPENVSGFASIQP